MHNNNWIQLYLEELKGTLDYQGFIKPERKPSIGWPSCGEEFTATRHYSV
jgi:hypothetical protein